MKISIKSIFLGLILGYLLALVGAWITYPEHVFHPYLVVLSWLHFFPNLPFLIWFTTICGIVLTLLISIEGKIIRGKYGYARFAKKYDIKNFGLNFKEGIVLGKAFGKIIRCKAPLSVLILAPPGTGKTSGIIIPTLLTMESSVVVHDPKGELYELTKKCRGRFSKILLFDPLSDESCVFNPFDKSMIPKDKRDIRAYILNLASILFKPHNENADSFFIDAAKSAFLFFTEWLIWKKGETSLSEIRNKLLDSTDVVSTIRLMLAEANLPQEIVKDGNGVLVSEDSEKQWAGVVGTLKETVELFADSRVVKATSGKNEIHAETFRKENISLYIKVREKDSKRLEPLNTMLIESLGTQLISQTPEDNDKRVTFVLDEFVRLGKMNIVRDLPAISRGYNVNTIFVAQDYEQISIKYGKETVSTFDSNCSYKIIFQQNNLHTAEKISKTIGNKTNIRKSEGKSINARDMQLNNSVGQNISTSEEGLALVSPQDILSMKKNCSYIMVQGFAAFPIKSKIPFYFNERTFRKLV